MTLNNHINIKKGQVEAITKMCIFSTSDKVLQKIKMESMIKIYKTCIIPSLTYACKLWSLSKENEKQLEQIQLNALRQILQIPKSTPIMAIFVETGELPIIQQIELKQIKFLWKMFNSKDE